MADKEEADTDKAPIKPVSSLLSHFEGLANLKGPPGSASHALDSPRISKYGENVEASSSANGRVSLDLPRAQSPWRSPAGQPEPAKRINPNTPPSLRNRSPGKYGHSRPMSMNISSSPSLAPAVTVESPKSPPRGHLFARNKSRSPERRQFLPFSQSGSQHSSRHSSRPGTPRTEDERPAVQRGNSHEAKLTGKIGTKKAPPPPVPRAEKPRIPAKPAAPLLVPETIRNTVDAAGSGMDPRISPFSTPPGSDGSPSPERPSMSIALDSIVPRLTSLSSEGQQQAGVLNGERNTPAPSLPKDPRLSGYSKTTEATEKRDPRSMGLSSGRVERAETTMSKRSTLPVQIPAQRQNTMPFRDPRTLGLSIAVPTPPAPRRSEDNQQRPNLIPAVERKAEQPAKQTRDPRTLGFSSAPNAFKEVPEDRPGLPPRRTDSLPPSRPLNAVRISSTPREEPPPPRVFDRSTKPMSNLNTKTQQVSVASAGSFPPPPRRNTSVAESNPRSSGELRQYYRQNPEEKMPGANGRVVDAEDSDEAGNALGETSVARTEYPDTSQANRRPPLFASGIQGIATKSEMRVFDVCGSQVCTSGYVSRVWDLTNGEQTMNLSHGETVKVLTVIFKPAARLEDEGARIWVGNNIGDIHEIDVMTQSAVATSSAHNRREVVKLLRHKKDVWSLDDEGKLFVWTADETGSPNMTHSHISHKVQRGHSFSIVVDDHLWLATGRELRVYRPGSENGFQVLQKPLMQQGAGEITSGATVGSAGDKVYFGHTDGRVTIYSTRDYSCIGSTKASDYKINAMVVVGDLLWAAFKTGKIYVYNTASTPWKVRKDWRAHDGPIAGMVLDTRSIWTLNRLQITSLGQDNCIRSWDGMLEDDWLEIEMQKRDVEYCRFREIRASVLTWNVGASTPYDIRNDFIRDAIHAEDPPEVLVFGFQELVDLEDRALTAKSILGLGKKKDTAKAEHISRVYREWRDYLGTCINRYIDASVSYTELHTSSLIGLFLCVFVRQDEKRSITGVKASEVKCGLKGHYGNKGALILRFLYDDSSVCFVNCHLAAGQTQTSHRNNDVASILEAESLPAEPSLDVRTGSFVGGGDGTQIMDHEICVINGDLNYRIDAMTRNVVVDHIKRNDLSKLLERDQLLLSRKRVPGFRLSPFVEAPITFAPTYKYDVGTDSYDTSEKKRSPAWCDRLLYRGAGRIKQIEYRRHEVRVSDHRPVSGTFRIRLKTIDPTKRADVHEDCVARFAEVKRKIAAEASVDYLVGSLGLEGKEAQELIAQG